MKKILCTIFLVVFAIFLGSCDKKAEGVNLETGDDVSCVTLSIDGESVTINAADDSFDTLAKLSKLIFIPTSKANEQKTTIKRSYDKKNVYSDEQNKLVTEKTSDESEKSLTNYLGYSKDERLYSYSYVLKKNEGDGLKTYVDDNLKIYSKIEEIDSTSEYYIDKYNKVNQSINTIKYLYDNGENTKVAEVTANLRDLNRMDFKEANNYLSYTTSDVSMYLSNPFEYLEMLKKLSSDYYEINIKLTEKYIIFERTINFSSKALMEYIDGSAGEDVLKKSKDNGDELYLLAYYDYNNINKNTVYADYYEYTERINESSSSEYTAMMNVPSEYVGKKYSIEYKSEISFILNLKEFSEDDINNFKESIK